jgi:predicted deacylase
MCHQDRAGVYAWLAAAGFVADTPETLRTKIRTAHTDIGM